MSKTPRYTQSDLNRFKSPYRKAVDTNIKLTFARARAAEEAKRLRAQEIEAEQAQKVRKMKGTR